MFRAIVTSVVVLTLATTGYPAPKPRRVAADAPCLPPGVDTTFFYWPVVAFRQLSLETEAGDKVPGFWVLYRRGPTGIAAIWSLTDLLAVDPSPDTDDPEWVDGALVIDESDSLILRSKRQSKCQWHRYKQALPRAALPGEEG